MSKALLKIGKHLLRQAINRMGIDAVRHVARNGPQAPALELLIEHSVLSEGVGTILQVGANDGTMNDPVHEIISRLKLPAILIEPLPDLFAKLRENYAGCPNVHFENCAISTEPGQIAMYRVRNEVDLPLWIQGIASLDRRVLLSHRNWPGVKNLDKRIDTISVPVMTVSQIIAKHADIGKITALQIDTEGHDYIVVRSAIEAGLRPRIVAYEHKHLSFADQEACRVLLDRNGYGFLTLHTDTVAYKLQGSNAHHLRH